LVGWLYIEGQVAAPIHVLDLDPANGMLSIEIAAKFVPDASDLRAETVVEYRSWKTRRQVRCLGAQRVGTRLLIEAVDIGSLREMSRQDEENALLGEAEDWLIVDGQPVCLVDEFGSGARPGSVVGHCMMRVPSTAWRDLRVGESAPLAAVGVASQGAFEPAVGAVTPPLRSALVKPTKPIPRVEVVRLRERMKFSIVPLASDWTDAGTLIVARVDRVASLGGGNR